MRSLRRDGVTLFYEVPDLHVAADELPPRSDMSRFHELFPQILYDKTVGSGHFCQLEVSGQINAMIERFLALPGKAHG
jgi:pimeloyl-ACP methyl ester carboxylesterase